MDFVFESSMILLKSLSGDKRVRIFTIQRGLLNIFGFNWWPGGMNLPFPEFFKFKLYPLFWILLLIYCSSMTVVASVNINPTNDFEFTKKMNGFILAMTFFASPLKVLFFIWMKQDIINLCEMCEKLGKVDLEKEPMIGSLRSCIFYGHLLLLNAVTWSSYYLGVYHDLPFVTDYPWSQENISGFLAAVLLDIYCGVYCGFGHILVDTMFPMCVSTTCAHLQTLSSFLGELGTGYWTDNTKLSVAVELHNNLLTVNRQMVKCYSKLFVTQAVYTVLHACLCIFAVTKVNDKFAVAMSSIPMLSAAYVQLYMYCSYGQMLTTKFDELTFASYNNKWYRCGTRARKGIALFMEACKRPVSLRGFGSIKASLANYLHSIQESVSYFLILKTITSDAKNIKS